MEFGERGVDSWSRASDQGGSPPSSAPSPEGIKGTDLEQDSTGCQRTIPVARTAEKHTIAMPKAHWRIQLLGELRATLGDRVVARFHRQKARELLAYLALHLDRSHPRETLLELIWQGTPRAPALTGLRVALHELRGHLEPPGG